VNLQQAVSRIIAALDKVGLEYMLVGSFSSMYYSFPRSTTDADFVIGTPDWDAQELAALLGDEFKLDPQLSFETFGGLIKNEIQIKGTPFRVKLIRLTNQPFDLSRFERRRRIVLAGIEVWIPSPEDVILQKLIWCRAKDQEDILGVIVVNQETLDRGYLEKWAGWLGLTELLANAWALANESNG